ncbi:MAG: acyl-CoA-binding protein [Bdellovibrionales bacterium]|nr:acyl-CoA-binding protein [Bdellovibrionales bacterium]
MPSSDQFQSAVSDVTKLKKKPSDKDLLLLYAHYKQATEGDVSGKRPGMINLVARKKFDAWNELQGTSKENAQKAYVAIVERLKTEIGMQ